MTTPDPYAEELIPAKAPEADFSHVPEHDPGTENLDPDEQGGGDH